MDKLNYILDRINKTAKGISRLEIKIKGVYILNQVYIIKDLIYDVNFIFNHFEKDKNGWKSNVDIEIRHTDENELNKVKKAIFDDKLKDIINNKVYELLMHLVNISDVMKSLNK